VKKFLLCSAAIAILAVAAAACYVLVAVHDAVAAVPGELRATRAELAHQVEELRSASLAEIRRQASPLAPMLDRQLSEITGRLDSQLSGMRQDIRDSVFLAVSPVQGLREDLAPTLANLQGITANANEATSILFRRDALPAQLLGVTAAAKVTLGQTALTMRSFQETTPSFLQTLQKVAANSDQATAKTVEAAEESRRLLHNLAENTTPLPKWIRYPAQVIGLAGSAAVPVVTLQRLSKVP